MELSHFLSQLRSVGTSPYAFAAYIAVVAAWVYTTSARHRLNKVAQVLKDLPPKDRIKLIEQEYRTSPRKGLSAEQWIRSRRHTLLLVAFLSVLICATVVVIIAFVLSFSGDQRTSADLGELRESMERLNAESQEIRNGLLTLIQRVPDLDPDVFAAQLQQAAGITFADDASWDDPSLSKEERNARAIAITMDQLQRNIAAQNELVNSLPPSPERDVEDMKLKRLEDKRAQQFAALRQIINDSRKRANEIIDSIGRGTPPP
jgi:hypothetical protein